MSVALSATIQQNSHSMLPSWSTSTPSSLVCSLRSDSNNLMNSSVPNLTAGECRQSEELNNQMMNCLRYATFPAFSRLVAFVSCQQSFLLLSSFQPSRCTSEFVRKQLQNTIHGRQKPNGGKDLSAALGSSLHSSNLDSSKAHALKGTSSISLGIDQKGAYFRNQLSSPMSTPPPLPTHLRHQHPGKPIWLPFVSLSIAVVHQLLLIRRRTLFIRTFVVVSASIIYIPCMRECVLRVDRKHRRVHRKKGQMYFIRSRVSCRTLFVFVFSFSPLISRF